MSKSLFLGAHVVLAMSLDIIAEREAREREEAKAPRDGFTVIHGFIPPVEEGVVLGVAEYLHSEPKYFVRYRAADGRQVEDWFSADAIAIDPRVDKLVAADDEAMLRRPKPSEVRQAFEAADNDTDGASVTDASTAASIAGQGALATSNRPREISVSREIRRGDDTISTNIYIPFD